MKPILLAPCMLALTGCIQTAGISTSGPSTSANVTITDPKIASAVGKIQGYAVKACGYEPIAASVLAMLTANEGVLTATQLATRFCGALTTNGAVYASRKSPPLPPRRPGSTASGTAVVNGKPVDVSGVKK